MNPQWVVLSFFLIEFTLLSSNALALSACPGQTFYLKPGEALEIAFNRSPGCDVRFIAVERGAVERKLFYPSGKTDDRRLTARERDIPEAWSELPHKAYLKASAETVVRFLAQSPPTGAREKAPQEVCPGMVLHLSPGEEIVVRWGKRPDCTVGWINYKGRAEELVTYPSGKTDRRVIGAVTGEFRYAETPLLLRIKAITPTEITFLAQRPALLQKPSPRLSITDLISHEALEAAILVLAVGMFVLLLIGPARSSSVFIIGHWSKLIENLQASPKDFYASVENAVARREVPSISNCRVDWKEGGLFTAWREYLRISREKNVVDICGAPYGTGFFVSWWHGELRPSALGPTLAAIALFVVIDINFSLLFDFITRLLALTITFIALFLFLGILIGRSAGQNWVRYVLVIPVIGWLLDRFFLPPTYYRIDSASMFQAAINQAVQEVIDQMTEAKGLRALTELERKPILRDFFQTKLK